MVRTTAAGERGSISPGWKMRVGRILTLPLLMSPIVACGDSSTEPDSTIAGVDMDVLFAPPSQSEIDAIAAE